jgi:hypothetical protein
VPTMKIQGVMVFAIAPFLFIAAILLPFS